MRYKLSMTVVAVCLVLASEVAAVTWSAPVDLSAPGHSAQGPQVIVSADGIRLASVWRSLNGSSRINQTRTRQAIDAGASVVVTGCPFCLTMLSDGVKELNVEDQLRATDLAQLVAEACEPAALSKGA